MALVAAGCRCALASPEIDAAPTPVEPPSSTPAHAERPARVVLVTVDSLRRDAITLRTPALYQLQREGTSFGDATAPSHWVKPSIASLLTSLAPARHRVVEETAMLPGAIWTLSEELQCAGFATASFYANGFLSSRFGFDQGWDHHENAIRDGAPSGAADVLGRASTWIDAHPEDAFFVHVHLIDPYLPYDPPEAQRRSARPRPRPTWDRLPSSTPVQVDAEEAAQLRGQYAAKVRTVDSALSTFRAALPAGTWMVLTASDGEALGEDDHWGGDDVPVARDVPLLFAGPGITQDRRWGVPVGLIDVAPTILALAGRPPSERFEGRSLLPLLRPGAPHDAEPGPARETSFVYPSLDGNEAIPFDLCMQMVSLAYIDLGGLSEEEYCRRAASEGPPNPPSSPCAP